MRVQTPRPPIVVAQLAPGDLPRLRAAAAADGHAVILPTHQVQRAGAVVGYASLGAARLFVAWLQSDLTARESFTAWHQAEAILDRAGGAVCLAITENSPLRPFAERKGYTHLGNAHLYLKESYVL